MITQEPSAATSQGLSLAERRAFMRLPLEERRRRLTEQAARLAEHYEPEAATTERLEWQGGDIVES